MNATSALDVTMKVINHRLDLANDSASRIPEAVVKDIDRYRMASLMETQNTGTGEKC
jgi:hypothetical protein